MRENTTDEEYQVCLELLKLVHKDWNFLLDCISEKSLMPFYLEDSIENLSKYKTKQDVLGLPPTKRRKTTLRIFL